MELKNRVASHNEEAKGTAWANQLLLHHSFISIVVLYQPKRNNIKRNLESNEKIVISHKIKEGYSSDA